MWAGAGQRSWMRSETCGWNECVTTNTKHQAPTPSDARWGRVALEFVLSCGFPFQREGLPCQVRRGESETSTSGSLRIARRGN